MPVVSFEIDDHLRERIEAAASACGVSVEEFVVSAVFEKLAVDRLRQRVARGSREKLQRILDRVPHVPPDPGDEI
ncbi:MAG TPA: hypothetical protein VF771_01360 [Longimicrobiaceae bacterium]